MNQSSRQPKETRKSTLSIISDVVGIISALMSILLFFTSAQIVLFIFLFFSTIPVWGTTLILLLSGFVLFWVRSKFRWQYGLIEYSVGFTAAINVFLPLGFDYSQIKYLAILQVLGGAYIMVRGLDNFSIGIKGTWFEKHWERVFGMRFT